MNFVSLLKHTKILSKLNVCYTRSICGLFEDRTPPVVDTDTKVTVVGSGKVAAACAMSLLVQNISDNVVLLDNKNANRLNGEVLDMQHGSLFFSSQVRGTTDYKETANSKICILSIGCKGAHTKQEVIDLAQKNIDGFKKILPQILTFSPNIILLIISNPVDIMTYVAWKISSLPINKIIGIGTTLDSARFSQQISHKLGIPPRNCQAYIIGGHNLYPVPVWSSISLVGDRLIELNPHVGTDQDKEKWHEVYEAAINSPKQITEGKGNTCWAKGLAAAAIVKSIFQNTRDIYTVTTNLKNLHGISYDVFLSLPCVLNACGIHKVVIQQLNDKEKEQLLKCAEKNKKVADCIKICG
ncbi:hypothetical protein WA026_012633 [Henosepilachna vigintioctopunctata]|uniref:L-lactate dehydrogenase n=1 Tax=Henosepilachna vigintioctopunctata TaxID=420089 RepID=A0AAW1U6Q1_9CUCU